MVFCRTELFTNKFPICGTALVLTQFKRKDDAAEYCADLAEETLGGELWRQRLEATVADGEETLADARFMSCAHEQLQTLYQITVANGWLADEDAVGFAQLAARLAAYRLVELEGGGARSIGGSARRSVPAKTRVRDVISQVVRQFVGDWERVHERPDGMRQQYVPRPPLDAPKITLLAQSFALGDGYVRGRVRAGDFWKWVWANCRTGNTSQLALLEDGILRDAFEAYWAASRLLLPLVRALERAHATRDAVAAARAALAAVAAWEDASAAALALTPAAADDDDDAAVVALRAAGAPVAPVAALDAALVDALDGAARAARAATVAAARASNDAPTLGPPADDGGAVDALEAFVGALREASTASRALEVVPAPRDGAAAAGALVAAPGAAGAPGALDAAVVRGARDALVASAGDVLTALAAPRAGLAAVAAAGADGAAGRAARALLAAFDAFTDAAGAARAASDDVDAQLSAHAVGTAAAPHPFTTAAAVVTRAALVGCAVDDTISSRDARALLDAALPPCNAVVEATRCDVVIKIYDGDGGRFGGHKERNTSRLLDALRSFYDKDRSEKRDLIEREAKDLQALGLGDFVGDVKALTEDQSVEWVAGVIANTAGGWLSGGETLVRGFAFPGDLTTMRGRIEDVRYSREQLARDLSLLNAYCRLSNVHEFSRRQPVDLAKCGVDASWLSNQLKGFMKEGKKRWVLRGNRAIRLWWRLAGTTRWRCVTRDWTPIGRCCFGVSTCLRLVRHRRDALRYVADRWRGIDPWSHRSRYFMHQPLRDVTRVEVRWAVACSSDDAARALLARATAVTVTTFREALVVSSRTRRHGDRLPNAVAHRWAVVEVVDAAAPQLVAGAPSGVAGALWTRYLDLGEAEARPRVLAAAVAAALDVAADDVIISVRGAAVATHVTALGRAPLISDALRAIPATGGSDALDAVGAALDAHFAPPPSSSEEDEEDDAATAPPPAKPLTGHRVFMEGRGKSGVYGRHADSVRSLGADVVGNAESPTIAILPNNNTRTKMGSLSPLQSTHRIVRERWLLRLEGLAPGASLPDTRPDAVFALVRDILDPRSYFYDAQAPPRVGCEKWRIIREDWTPAAQAGGDTA